MSLRNFTHLLRISDVLACRSNVRVFVYIENIRSSNSIGSLCFLRTTLALYPTLISTISSQHIHLSYVLLLPILSIIFEAPAAFLELISCMVSCSSLDTSYQYIISSSSLTCTNRICGLPIRPNFKKNSPDYRTLVERLIVSRVGFSSWLNARILS